MAYTKVPKPVANWPKVTKPTDDSWLSHLFGCLLCEDGSYLLQETGGRIALEMHHGRITKSTTTFSGGVKPNIVWTK
jgi:hypothetical protein